VVVAVAGEFGTLSEIALALRLGRSVIGLSTWELVRNGQPVDVIIRADDPRRAAELAQAAAEEGRSLS
jgi:predicted Rossmann-fold nucleotide-binding protein